MKSIHHILLLVFFGAAQAEATQLYEPREEKPNQLYRLGLAYAGCGGIYEFHAETRAQTDERASLYAEHAHRLLRDAVHSFSLAYDRSREDDEIYKLAASKYQQQKKLAYYHLERGEPEPINAATQYCDEISLVRYKVMTD